MAQRFANNASTRLAQPVTAAATTFTVASAHGFPVLSGSEDYFLGTLIARDGNGRETGWEIVSVVGTSGPVFTVVRAREGTTALAWPVGAEFELRLTAGGLHELQGQAPEWVEKQW